MSQRERWIVYPLLFLALGVALRDKFVPPRIRALSVEADVIQCGRLEVPGLVDCRVLTVGDSPAESRVRLHTVDGSGRAEFEMKDKQSLLVLGADDDGRVGLFSLRPDRERLVPLTLYDLQFKGKPKEAVPAPEAKPAKSEPPKAPADRK